MDWEAWGVILLAITMLGSVMGVVYHIGQFKARFESLREWFERENTRNSDQHRQFYDFGHQVTTLVADHGNMEKRLDSIETKLDTVIDRLGQIVVAPPPRPRARKVG
jgi:hypothetical protein